MADPTPQNFDNHRRFVPLYHIVIFAALGANVFASLYYLVTGPGLGTVINVTTALSLVGVFLYARLFPLAAQDRVIRLEEKAWDRPFVGHEPVRLPGVSVHWTDSYRTAAVSKLSAGVRQQRAGGFPTVGGKMTDQPRPVLQVHRHTTPPE